MANRSRRCRYRYASDAGAFLLRKSAVNQRSYSRSSKRIDAEYKVRFVISYNLMYMVSTGWGFITHRDKFMNKGEEVLRVYLNSGEKRFARQRSNIFTNQRRGNNETITN